MWCRSLLFGVACFGVGSLFAQAPEGVEGGRHKLALFSGHSWVPEGRSAVSGERITVLAPTFGIDYEYRLNARWSIGSYNDVEVMRFLVEEEEGRLLERENVLLLSVGGAYEPFVRFSIQLGAGVETDAHGTLAVGRLGVEYGLLVQRNMELSVAASYLNKEVYDVFSLGLALGFRFGPKDR